jgi:zinc and cadmium transporter
MFLFMSIAVGALLGDAFIHLIPEAFEQAENPTVIGILVIVGIFSFFALEKFLHWHHHGEDAIHTVHPVGKLVLFSDGVHNFIDGVIIGASFLISIPVGIATTMAVILHEIPQEVGDFSVLLHAGYSKVQALWLNFVSALTALLGLIVFFVVGSTLENIMVYILPVAAGGFIYIALADLIPELHKTKKFSSSVSQLFAVIAGVAIMLSLTWLE